MLKHINCGTPFYMSDCQNSYAYPVEFLNESMKINMMSQINVGLYFLAKRDFTGLVDLA